MKARRLDFARRPFVDERPFLFGAGFAVGLGALLLFANVRQYSDFHHEMEGTSLQIESLEGREQRASREAATARAALDSYRVSTLATESRALLKLIAERRFSWTGLLARLERTLPADVRVTRLSPRFEENAAVLDCAFVGKTHEAVVRTIAALSKDPMFDAVELRSEAAPEGAGAAAAGYSFELALKYRAVPGATP